MWFDDSGPPAIGFYDGPVPGSTGYNRPPPPPPPTLFGNDFDNGMFPASPFGVPPMMMLPQIPNGMSPQGQQSRSTPKIEEGVKVPKDPFVERQKQKKEDQVQTSSSSSSSRISTKSLSEPDIKIPNDPFAERWKKQDGQPPKSRPQKQFQTKGQAKEAGNNNEIKRPTEPLLDRSREIVRPKNQPSHNDEFSRRRSVVDNERMSPLSGKGSGNNDGVKRPREPFTAKRYQVQQPLSQPPSSPNKRQSISQSQGKTTTSKMAGNNTGGSRRFGGNISFGSQNGGDMTFEEYSSYFDVP